MPSVSATAQTDCIPCPSGTWCALGSFATSPCPAGHYCLQNTVQQFQYPCSAGTYNSLTSAIDASWCLMCGNGTYCPAGSVTPIMCPPGTVSAQMGAPTLDFCAPCPAGFSCPLYATDGYSVPIQTCAAGYFCPKGTAFPTDNPCPAGTYSDSVSLIQADDCTTCEAGLACDWHSTSADKVTLVLLIFSFFIF